jgi:hypothetical protein
MSGWSERMRGLGRSVVELLRAELAALSDDLGRSRRLAGQGLTALAVGLALVFWAVGALVTFVVLVLAIWLPAWAAVGLVLLLLVAAAAAALRQARARFAAVENPLATVRRHVDDHLVWWQGQLAELGSGGGGAGEEGTAGTESAEAAAPPSGFEPPWPGTAPGGVGERR